MLTAILAAIAAVTTPAPAAKLDPATDTPAVCAIRFNDNMNRIVAGGEPNSPVISIYAGKAKLSATQTEDMTKACDLFDMGAMYGIAGDGAGAPTT